MKPFFAIPYYHDYLSPELAEQLLSRARPVAGVADLVQVGDGGGLETPEALGFLAALYSRLEPELARVLAQRTTDRKFLDERVRACQVFNDEMGRDWLDPDYKTVLGLEDAHGRVVIGPLSRDYCRAGGKPVAPLPAYLQGPHVTLFGPPDSAKMAINAMNAYHRKLPGEPAIVEALLARQKASPMWGADDEDSKTPLRSDLVDAAVNLTACFEGTISLTEGAKKYELAGDHLSLPIKRFPGLALPSSFLFYRKSPIPLHLYDFALHLFRNWNDPRSLVFYVPKLENEEEAAYIASMIRTAEEMIQAAHPSYKSGTVRLMIVLENPRAILRAHEIIDALHPYFAGASLGWHDYLASTARLFKEDSNYRIPVKADPNIVIKYIKASHELVAHVVGSRGGIKVGGMYGILPLAGHAESLQITLRGFFKDVITQMKRNLTGFWVAHPDFVRLGLAIVQAWREREGGDPTPLRALVEGLLVGGYAKEVIAFIEGADIESLNRDDPTYVRKLIVVDIKESDFIANNHPDEIRYNIFQSLQYLTDWLSGNGCVALPTIIDGIPVRVMDDLATAERSRWEVWHELRHGRFSIEEFVRIAHEEMNFIRRDLSDSKKIVAVKWDERTARWYPVAFRLMLQLMTQGATPGASGGSQSQPPEFATELLIPFTIDEVRAAPDPWAAIQKLDPGKYRLDRAVADFDHYFEICGARRFAREMATRPIEDLAVAESIVLGFSKDEVVEAASFHGDIGQNRATLDARAAGEQAAAASAADSVRDELKRLGDEYRARHGFKFLVSAQGKSADEMLGILKSRLSNDSATELKNAREALWEICRKRLASSPRPLMERLEEIRKRHGIRGASLAVLRDGQIQALALGEASSGRAMTPETPLQIASLSKSVASALAIEIFCEKGIQLTASVQKLLSEIGSPLKLTSSGDPTWAARVTVADLMSHSALGMHYVNGIPAGTAMPSALELAQGGHGYEKVSVVSEPGKSFSYSGGGYLVLEHLLEKLTGKHVAELAAQFTRKLGMNGFTFVPDAPGGAAEGFFDDGKTVPKLRFPAFAAGAWATPRDVASFLSHLEAARVNLDGSGPISHDTAMEMLFGTDKGCRAFMGCDMGLGVFTIEAGANRLALHQGANEGFRALYLHCYAGPDRGKGMVIFANGDNRAVLMIAEMARELLQTLDIGGIDFSRMSQSFDFSKLPQAQIVNLGYKKLIFEAFEQDLPNPITAKGPRDPLADRNLAVGVRVVACTNQRFARAENLVSDHLPIFDPELFERQGKTMDSWESVRHNAAGVDRLELELKKPGPIRYVSLSTKYHDGNQAESVRLEAFDGKAWFELLPKTPVAGHALFRADLGKPTAPVSRVRVEMFPDGGLSRLQLFSDLSTEIARDFKPLSEAASIRFDEQIPKSRKPLTIPYAATPAEIASNRRRARVRDLASAALGGQVIRASNEHYSPASAAISPFPPLHMFDGMESARSRKPGHHEEVQIRLAEPARIQRIVLDFRHFVNNNPVDVDVQGLCGGTWVELVPRTRVKPFAGNARALSVRESRVCSEIRVRTFPDGGINRVRVY